jgi:L,D-transpeptidase catalytic domain
MRSVLIALTAAGLLQLAARGVACAAPDAWSGSIRGDGAVVYDAPGGTPVGTLAAGARVSVWSWRYGPQLTSDNFTWAHVGGGRFVHSSVLLHAPLPDAPPPPPWIISSGHWADANLTQQILTLYDGERPVRWSLMSSGRPGADTESHEGVWSISSRVANETMRGDGYGIAGVLFTQYFTPDAEGLHLNYWLSDDERGIPRSHGCLGLAYYDAAFAWRFLNIGSSVFVHT